MPSVSAKNGVRLFVLITLWMSGNIKSSPGILGRCYSIPWFPVPESGCRNSRPRSLQGVARTTLSRSGLSVRPHGPRILLDVRRFPSILRPCNPITPISRVGQEASAPRLHKSDGRKTTVSPELPPEASPSLKVRHPLDLRPPHHPFWLTIEVAHDGLDGQARPRHRPLTARISPNGCLLNIYPSPETRTV